MTEYLNHYFIGFFILYVKDILVIPFIEIENLFRTFQAF